MSQAQTSQTIDFYSDTYRDTFSRINGIVIEGEQEAHDNFICLSELLPDHLTELQRLGRIEARHRKGFEACGRNLNVVPDLTFAQEFFAELRQAFQNAAARQQIATCLLIQALVIECFAIAAYHHYIPVADDFARQVTASIVADEYSHLNFGEVWLKANFETVKEELAAANCQILPMIWRMLNQIASDARVMGIDKQSLVEEFMARYGDALHCVGFSTRDILRLASYGLTR